MIRKNIDIDLFTVLAFIATGLGIVSLLCYVFVPETNFGFITLQTSLFLLAFSTLFMSVNNLSVLSTLDMVLCIVESVLVLTCLVFEFITVPGWIKSAVLAVTAFYNLGCLIYFYTIRDNIKGKLHRKGDDN